MPQNIVRLLVFLCYFCDIMCVAREWSMLVIESKEQEIVSNLFSYVISKICEKNVSWIVSEMD